MVNQALLVIVAGKNIDLKKKHKPSWTLVIGGVREWNLHPPAAAGRWLRHHGANRSCSPVAMQMYGKAVTRPPLLPDFSWNICRKPWNLPWNLQKSGEIHGIYRKWGGLPAFSLPPNVKSGKMSWNQCETPCFFFLGKALHLQRVLQGTWKESWTGAKPVIEYAIAEYSLTILPCLTSFHWGQIYTSYHCETLYPLREWDDSR